MIPVKGFYLALGAPDEQGFVLGDSEVDLISRKPVMTPPRGMVKRWRGCKIEFIVRNPESWGSYISGEGTERSIAAASPQKAGKRIDTVSLAIMRTAVPERKLDLASA